jgi:hypothetical protein
MILIMKHSGPRNAVIVSPHMGTFVRQHYRALRETMNRDRAWMIIWAILLSGQSSTLTMVPPKSSHDLPR